jgi:ribosomal protein S18 acetylase RimI-like enzyme
LSLTQDSAPSFALRPATPGDEPFRLALYTCTRDDLNLLDWDENQKRALLEMQFRAQSSQYHLTYPEAAHSIVLIEGRPVGCMIVDRNEREITLVDIAIMPLHRHNGIGTTLLSELLGEGGASGRPVRLHVLKSNPAQRLYLRLGFSIVGEDGLYFEMKSGQN